MAKSLGIFYVATINGSVYSAKVGGEGIKPILAKLFPLSAPEDEVAWKIGQPMSNGTMLAIAKRAILFIPHGRSAVVPYLYLEREIGLVEQSYWGASTSEIVALFFKELDARDCAQSENLETCDPRWRNSTIQVLKRIGKNHPFCSISTLPLYRLMDPAEWQT